MFLNISICIYVCTSSVSRILDICFAIQVLFNFCKGNSLHTHCIRQGFFYVQNHAFSVDSHQIWWAVANLKIALKTIVTKGKFGKTLKLLLNIATKNNCHCAVIKSLFKTMSKTTKNFSSRITVLHIKINID